ncbi:uncharacterized protein FFM5_15055 [Fusarium fujikuroi]|nr:uncharacterized protein FFM5_15055 [Fusarium fujikuroi]
MFIKSDNASQYHERLDMISKHLSAMAVDGFGAGTPAHYDTIVIGAGISGLAFASRILQSNDTSGGCTPRRLRILEARDRIGGRIASVDVQGQRLDTGANWIHGIGTPARPNPLMSIVPQKRYRAMQGSVLFQTPAEEQNSETCKANQQVSSEGTVCPAATTMPKTTCTNGLVVPTCIGQLIASCHEKAIAQVQDLAAGLPEKAAKYVSILQSLVSRNAFQNAFEVVPREYHHTLGSLFQGIESMEAAPLLARTTEPLRSESKPGVGLLEYAVDDFDGEHIVLQDGYIEITNEIAKPLLEAGSISFNTVVTGIAWGSNPISIETTRGNFTAREVVCTMPLGVLKDTAKTEMFTPSLPADKQEAIESLGFGTLDKVFAVYSKPWWNDEPYRSIITSGFIRGDTQSDDDMPDSFLGFTSELSGISISSDGSVTPDVYRLPVMNLDSLTGQPVLCAFVSCNTSITVEEKEDEDVGQIFHRALTQWFGVEPPEIESVHVTRWGQDAYSKGSYSHMITGVSEIRHRELLQVPMINEDGGVLRFAGEHCSRDHFAMAHGALLDGWRAAEESSQYLKINSMN